MPDFEILLLLVLCLTCWFWIDSVGAREIAVSTGRAAAERYGLQFLDETVALSHLGTARDAKGRLRLKRTYAFEVSDTGMDRLPCSLVLLGKCVESVDIPPVLDNVVRLY